MNPIESQTQILDQLCHIMHISAEEGYSTLRCRFDYSASPDGSSSVGAQFCYVIDGKEKSTALVYPERKKLGELVSNLHKEMQAHTGGNWTAFTLAIGEDGKAKANFEYSGNDKMGQPLVIK
jgi:hypothetical protein